MGLNLRRAKGTNYSDNITEDGLDADGISIKVLWRRRRQSREITLMGFVSGKLYGLAIALGGARHVGAILTQLGKFYAALLANPKAVPSFRDLERLLLAFGFIHVRTKGSHRQYVHPKVPRPFPVQSSVKDAKRYQIRAFLDLVEAYHLDMEG